MILVLFAAFGLAAPADTLRYAVTIQGNPAGASTVVRESATTTRIWFEFNDRGRGPKTETLLETTRAGLPRRIVVSGNDYLKQKVDERFSAAGGQAAWSSSSERGTGSARSFFLPRESAPEIMAALARALLRSPDHQLALLPGGRARLDTLIRLPVRRPDRSTEITLVAIDGLGFESDHLWLDRDSSLFAIVGGWQRVYQAGWEGTLDFLQKTQDSVTAAVAEATAKRLTDQPSGPVAFVDATIFDAAAARLIPAQTVLVEGNEIKAVGPSATMRLASSVRLIPARGKVLLPGLWDMHGHLSPVDGRLNIAAGVTSVRDMANDVEFLLATKKSFDAGTAIGPRVVMAGFIDGPGPYAGPTKALVSTAEQAIEWIDRYASLGYEQIKLYSSLDPALVPIIAERAHAKGMRLSGHIPRGMLAAGAVKAGYDEIQHTNMLFLNFLGDTLDTRTPLRFTAVAKAAADLDLASPAVREFLDLLHAKGTVVDPTLATFEEMFTADPTTMTPGNAVIATRLPPQVSRGLRGGGLPADPATRIRYRASYGKMLAMVKALYDRGIPIVAGTDCLAGMCLHRELELYVQAGIPANVVLKIATLGAATVARRADRLGTIEPGKLADLVLIAGNPVTRISDIRKVALVMKDGRIYDPAKVEASLGIRPWNAAGGRRQ